MYIHSYSIKMTGFKENIFFFVMLTLGSTAPSCNKNIYRVEVKLQITRERQTEGSRRKTEREGWKLKKKDRTADATGEVLFKNTHPAFLSNSPNY